jgi:outer membrane protein assembly factor BamB
MMKKVMMILLFAILCQSCATQPGSAKIPEKETPQIQETSISSVQIWKKEIGVDTKVRLFDPKQVVNDQGIQYLAATREVIATDIKLDKELWCYDTMADSLTKPKVDEKRVYVGSSLGIYFALDKKTGKVLWQYKAPKEIYDLNIIHKNSIIFRDYDSNLYSVDKETGKLIWRFSLVDILDKKPSSLFFGPIYSSGILYYAINQNLLFGVDADNGQIKWRTPVDYKNRDETVYDSNVVCFFSNFKSYTYQPSDKPFTSGTVHPSGRIISITAFNIIDGKKLWTQKITEKYLDKNLQVMKTKLSEYNKEYDFQISDNQISPFTKEGIVYYIDQLQVLHGFNLHTGKQVTNLNLETYFQPSRDFNKYKENDFDIVGDVAYFLGQEEKFNDYVFFALNLKTNQLLWKKTLGQFTKDLFLNSSISFKLQNSRIYLILKDRLLVLDQLSGKELWKIKVGFPFRIQNISVDILILVNTDYWNKHGKYQYAIQLK